jgi:hypothetical protein
MNHFRNGEYSILAVERTVIKRKIPRGVRIPLEAKTVPIKIFLTGKSL